MIAPSYFLGSQRIDQLHREADQARLAGLARLARRQRRHVVVQTRCAAVPGVLARIVISAFGNADGNVAPARKGRTAMLTQHDHVPGTFDAGHCRACAREAGLLDHYDRVQREEIRLRQTWAWACAARRYAIWALCSSGGGILLAAVALLTR
jgi:hypothetical protein